jgi:putative sterol carrier protein
VPDFLSAEWISALDAAAQSATLPDEAATVSITIEQVVRDAPGGDARYHLRIKDGRARVHPGPATAPDLTLFADYETAAQLQRGELNAQNALATGGLKVRGAFARLVRVDDALRALEDVFAPVRAATTYREAGPSR